MSVSGLVLITASMAIMLATQVHCSCKCDCPFPVLYQTHKFYWEYPDRTQSGHMNQIPEHAYQKENSAFQSYSPAQQTSNLAQQIPIAVPSMQGGEEGSQKAGEEGKARAQESLFLDELMAKAQEGSRCTGENGGGSCGEEGKEEEQQPLSVHLPSSVQRQEKPQQESDIVEKPIEDYFKFDTGATADSSKESPMEEANKDTTNEEQEDHHHHHHEHDKNIYYKFAYAVDDKKTHDVKYQKEERKGDVIEGEYALLEDDGNVRTVKYIADWKNGFRAQVLNSKKKSSVGFSR